MIYIHVPLCRSFCTYCGFYSEIARDGCKEKYLKALTAEILSSKGKDPGPVNTLYIGGGTPSVLDVADFRRVLSALEEAGFGTTFEEFTVEVNPEDIVTRGPSYVDGLLSLGVNRISVGIQSLSDDILKWMNRRHDASRGLEALRILRQSGVDNLSTDLIFGISGLSDEVWEDTIRRLLAAARPEHLSAYQLSLEEGSALAEKVEAGAYEEAAEDQCSLQYDLLCRLMRGEGYEHYEISNWALPGHRALHNSGYWRRIPYLGFGGGAHSFDGRVRFWNSPEISDYPAESEILEEKDVILERIMLSLRTADGEDGAFLHEHCREDVLGRLLDEGALIGQGSRIRIPEERFFVSDEIIKELI